MVGVVGRRVGGMEFEFDREERRWVVPDAYAQLFDAMVQAAPEGVRSAVRRAGGEQFLSKVCLQQQEEIIGLRGEIAYLKELCGVLEGRLEAIE